MKNITISDLYDFLVTKFDKIENRLERLEITQDYMLGELKDLKEEKIVGNYGPKEWKLGLQKLQKR